MKKYLGSFVMLAASLFTALPTWAMEIVGPDVLVDNTAQEVLAIVRQDKDIRAGSKTKLLEVVEAGDTASFRFHADDPACNGQELVESFA